MHVTLVYQVAVNATLGSSPFLSMVAKQFAVQIVLRQAMVSAAGGTLECAFIGEQDEINRAVAYLQTTGAGLTGPLVVKDILVNPQLSSVARGT